jgi:hypothetical protein
MPNGIVYIGTGAFRENQLTNVDIPASVTNFANAFDSRVRITRR